MRDAICGRQPVRAPLLLQSRCYLPLQHRRSDASIGLGEISPREFAQFIGKEMVLAHDHHTKPLRPCPNPDSALHMDSCSISLALASIVQNV
jgi:hypothetical protein